MSSFDDINLADLPPPDIIQVPDYETLLAEMKAELISRAPELADVLQLESALTTKMLEIAAYFRIIDLEDYNDRLRGVLLATSWGPNLDNLGALFGVARRTLFEGDDEAVPPLPRIFEGDDEFRRRVQLAPEAFTSGGTYGAYLFHALEADPRVLDANVANTGPGDCTVTILSRETGGVPSGDLMAAVTTALTDERVRVVCDSLFIEAATIVAYRVEAVLTIKDGPDKALVRAAAEERITAFVETQNRLGQDVSLSSLYAALTVEGVTDVVLADPPAKVISPETSAPFCTEIVVSVAP